MCPYIISFKRNFFVPGPTIFQVKSDNMARFLSSLAMPANVLTPGFQLTIFIEHCLICLVHPSPPISASVPSLIYCINNTYVMIFVPYSFFSLEVKQGENERSSLSLANESQFLLITRSSISGLLTNVEPNLDFLLVSQSS